MKHLYLAYILLSLLTFTTPAAAGLLEYQFIFSGPVYGGNNAMAVGTITIDSDMIANPGRNLYDPNYYYSPNYGAHADGVITALTVIVTGTTGGVGDGTFDLTNFDAVLFDTSLLALDLNRQIIGQPTASPTGKTWGEDDPIESNDPPQMYTGDFQLFAVAGSGAPYGIYPYQIGASEGNIDGMQLIAFGPIGLTVTTATVASSLNPSTFGNNVTFTATVAPAAATGTVTFKDGSATLGTGTLDNGTATYSTSALSVGDHHISAVYTGDNSYLGTTSTAITQTVNSMSDQTITFANPGTQAYGTTPTLTATATSLLAVTFTSATTGVCTVTPGGALSFVTTGSCTINANQSGNSAYNPAPQVQQTFTVARASLTPPTGIIKSGLATARTWTFRLTNSSSVAATNTQVGLTLTPLTSCTPLITATPVTVGTIAANGGSADASFLINFNNCPKTTKFNATFTSTYTGSPSPAPAKSFAAQLQ